MTNFGKLLLALSSLGPFFLACAFNCWRREDWTMMWTLIWVFVFCALISWLLPWYCRRNHGRMPLTTKKVKHADKDMLAFLLLYMLPLLTKENSVSFSGEPLTGLFILGIIVLAVTHSNSFTFNPMLGLLSGYHFYEIEDDKGMTLLFLSKKRLTKPDNTFTVVRLIDYVYLDAE